MTYGTLVWIKSSEGNNFIATLLAPLRKVQNIGLRRIAGAYRAASILNLEWEMEVEPINLYLKKLCLYRADEDKKGPITKVLKKH